AARGRGGRRGGATEPARPAAVARRRARRGVRPQRAPGRARDGGGGAAPRAARDLRRARARRPQLQGDGEGDGSEREHLALTKTVRRVAPAPAAAGHSRRARERVGDDMNRSAMKLLALSPLFVAAFAGFVALGGWGIMRLWNWLLPPLFAW